jgi:SAM-dependent methyltransferase
MSSKLTSPICGNERIVCECRIALSDLCERYRLQLGVDITGLVPHGLGYVSRYRCVRSGYRFYHPAIVGDADFYKQLQVHPWYYMQSKWEYTEALRHIPADAASTVLEVGCGRGEFLKRLRERNGHAVAVGLDLNEAAASDARRDRLDVREIDLGDFASANEARYDFVVAFQVLEHVPDPLSFLRSAVKALKVGGSLIVAVPDNSERSSPSLFVNDDGLLNMPPHHQGLWSVSSLAYLINVLPVELRQVISEPASARHHSNSYRGLMKRDLIRRFGSMAGTVLYAFGRPFYDHSLSHLAKYLPAHTVLALFERVGR